VSPLLDVLLDVRSCDHKGDHRCPACRPPCDDDWIQVPPRTHHGYHHRVTLRFNRVTPL
jgi:hypothetical protein